MDIPEFIEKYKPCPPARDWLETQTSLKSAYENCPDVFWYVSIFAAMWDYGESPDWFLDGMGNIYLKLRFEADRFAVWSSLYHKAERTYAERNSYVIKNQAVGLAVHFMIEELWSASRLQFQSISLPILRNQFTFEQLEPYL